MVAAIAKDRGWKPGTFVTEDFNYKKWVEVYGCDMLNSDIQLGKIHNIEPNLQTFFIRPLEDSKYFNGKVTTKEEFLNWRKEYIMKYSGKIDFESIEVIISPVNEVYSEYRCFVVDSKILAMSQYKSGSNVFLSDSIPVGCIEFVENRINQWCPSEAFVIDTCMTKEGYKIVEFNNYTSSGFYACDVVKIVEALDKRGGGREI